MLKTKKLFILFLIICSICVFTGCGAVSAKISRYYGTYISTTDNSSVIEFTDFDIPKRTGILNYNNINFPSYNIKGYSEKGAKVKVFKRKGRALLFSTIIEGQEITGSLDVDEKKVDLDGVIYIKEEF